MFLEIWISASKKLMPNADYFYLEKMTLVMTSLPLAHVFYVCLHVSFPLHNDWEKSDSSVDRYPQANWRWNSNSRDLVASSPSSPLPTARVHSLWWTLRVCSFKMMRIRIVGHLDHGTLILNWLILYGSSDAPWFDRSQIPDHWSCSGSSQWNAA